jgi:hypothetical protein
VFHDAVKKLFYGGTQGNPPRAIEAHLTKLLVDREARKVLDRWAADGTLPFSEFVPKALLDERVEGDPMTFGARFSVDGRSALPYRGFFVSGIVDGTAFVHRSTKSAESFVKVRYVEPMVMPLMHDRWDWACMDGAVSALWGGVVPPDRASGGEIPASRHQTTLDRLEGALVDRVVTSKRFSAVFEPLFDDLEEVHDDYLAMFEETRIKLDRFRREYGSWVRGVKDGVDVDRALETYGPFESIRPEAVDPELERMRATLDVSPDFALVLPRAVEELRGIADAFRLRRLDFGSVRVRLRKFVDTLSLEELGEATEFVRAVVEYYPVGGEKAVGELPVAVAEVEGRVTPRSTLPLASMEGASQESTPFPTTRVVGEMDDARRRLEQLGARFVEPSAAPAMPPVLSCADLRELPESWAALSRQIDGVIDHHRRAWKRVCRAYSRLQLAVLRRDNG